MSVPKRFNPITQQWEYVAVGQRGLQGKSAYDIALENGFIGSEEQWLAFLKGSLETISIVTSDHLAQNFTIIPCDTTNSSFSVTLPVDGEVITIFDVVGTSSDTGFGVNSLVVLTQNNQTIMGEVNFELDVGGLNVTFVRKGINWKVFAYTAPMLPALPDWNATLNKPVVPNWVGVWNAQTEYAVGYVVRYEGNNYIATQINSNVVPLSGFNEWDLFIERGLQGPSGGDDAYVVAVAQGFEGTRNEWLEHIRGKSAYELAVQEGFTGTLTDYIYQYFRSSFLTAFVTTWKTDNISAGSSNSNQVRLPLVNGGTYNFIVDWGDGTSDTITTWNQAEATHTYAVEGVYTIIITGQCEGWSFNNTGDRLKILLVHQWGSGFRFGNLGGYFWGCINCQFPCIDIPNLQGTINMTSCFRNCTMESVSGLGAWGMSNVTNMTGMFFGCSQFNQPLNSWNTSNVTSMGSMFNGCSQFNQPLNNWNTSNVTDMGNMLHSTALNTTNYSDILNAWSHLNLKNNVPLGASGRTYNAGAAAARQYIIDTFNWTITDGGQV